MRAEAEKQQPLDAGILLQKAGADGQPIDVGYVGEVTEVNAAALLECIAQGVTPVRVVREGGRVIYLEGSYVNTFSGNPHPTPYYEYNQIMYRLDLSDPRLRLPEETNAARSKP